MDLFTLEVTPDSFTSDHEGTPKFLLWVSYLLDSR